MQFLLGIAFRSCVESIQTKSIQRSPTWISKKTDSFWKRQAQNLFVEISSQHISLLKDLKSEKKLFGIRTHLDSPDESELQTQGTYGLLPEVLVDYSYTATVFPMPIARPHRYSWCQIFLAALNLQKELRQSRQSLEQWKESAAWNSPEDHRAHFDQVAKSWNQLNKGLISLTLQYRYLEAWIPQLNGRKPAFAEATAALLDGESQKFDALREVLKPKRVMRRPFLPEHLSDAKNGLIVLPIATDIQSRKFENEVEGALDTHWNQSSWARKNHVRFKIRWTHLPINRFFATHAEGLKEHLMHFPKDKAGITTGGLNTHVTGQVLVLGPGKIYPRTLAHELGHLLGFEDCYFRTLTSQGVFGLGVLEWDNPVYPDDLMCDNFLGEPMAEVW